VKAKFSKPKFDRGWPTRLVVQPVIFVL